MSIILPLLIFWVTVVSTGYFSPAAARESNSLLEDVRALELGFDGYLIGHDLSEKQLDFARKHELKDSYEGTLKFRDQGLTVVASRKDTVILAVYKDSENVDPESLKKGVAMTMDGFGEPTTMAHDKLIYWAYDKNGKIEKESFEELKNKGNLKVLATVKFNSSVPVAGVEEGNSEINYYIMVSSQPLIETFMRR